MTSAQIRISLCTCFLTSVFVVCGISAVEHGHVDVNYYRYFILDAFVADL